MKYPYPLVEFNNILDDDFCNELILDSENLLLREQAHFIHSGRDFIPSTSFTFQNLINQSKAWGNLNKFITSQKFFDMALESLNERNCFSLTKVFSEDYLFQNNFLSKIKLISEKSRLNHSSTKLILASFFFRSYLHCRRLFTSFSSLLFARKRSVEVLFDYSIVGKGYKNNIHRDADKRYIIFLIFLNDLPENDHEGNHQIFSKINDEVGENFKLEKSISPKKGGMIIFLNTDKSFHAAKEMVNGNNIRHFIYGSFTLLAGKNPNIRRKKIPIQWELYY